MGRAGPGAAAPLRRNDQGLNSPPQIHISLRALGGHAQTKLEQELKDFSNYSVCFLCLDSRLHNSLDPRNFAGLRKTISHDIMGKILIVVSVPPSKLARLGWLFDSMMNVEDVYALCHNSFQ